MTMSALRVFGRGESRGRERPRYTVIPTLKFLVILSGGIAKNPYHHGAVKAKGMLRLRRTFTS